MIGDKSSYKETPCIDSPTDRSPGIYSYLSGAVRLLVSTHFSGYRLAGHGGLPSLGVRASYFGGCAGWFSLVGGTIPFIRR